MIDFPEHEALCACILEKGILHSTPERPLTSRTGASMAWMMYMHGMALEADSLALAARGMLHLLERFGPCQLATLGTGAVPLMSACILQSQGRYRGLMLRNAPKAYGSGNLIDGPVDPHLPVVVVDDAIGSGKTMLTAIKHLEEHGLTVLGGACLVRFHWFTGESEMLSRGYQLACLVDQQRDLMARLIGKEPPPTNPALLDRTRLSPSNERVPEGLSLLAVAEYVAKHAFRHAAVLHPPACALGVLDTDGGIFLSWRQRSAPYHTVVREGFLRFPDEPKAHVLADLVLAAARSGLALRKKLHNIEQVDQLSLSLSAFSSMQACALSEIDYRRDALVVRSQARPERFGLALPLLPSVRNGFEQLDHARYHNAKLLACEPYSLYRCRLDKRLAPAVNYSHGGVPVAAHGAVPWYEDSDQIEPLLEALHVDLEALRAGQTPSALAPWAGPVQQLCEFAFITLYSQGRWCACQGQGFIADNPWLALLRRTLAQAQTSADYVADKPLQLTLHLLHHRREAGLSYQARDLPEYAHGVEALQVSQLQRTAIMLPHVVHDRDFTPAAFVGSIVSKAGIIQGPYQWQAYQVASWSRLTDGRCIAHEGAGFRAEQAMEPRLFAQQCLAHLARHFAFKQGEYATYLPDVDQVTEPSAEPLTLTGRLANLFRLREFALQLGLEPVRGPRVSVPVAPVLKALQSQPSWQNLEVAALSLLALCSSPAATASAASLSVSLAQSLSEHVFDNGGVAPSAAERAFRPPAAARQVPSLVLLALHRAEGLGFVSLEHSLIQRALDHLQHRARHARFDGMGRWTAQALASWGESLQQQAWQQQVLEEAECLLASQSAEGGFYQSEAQARQGAGSADAVQVMATASVLASLAEQSSLAQCYAASAARGLRFLTTLSVQPAEAERFVNPRFALGGVREHAHTHRLSFDATLAAAEAALWLYQAQQLLSSKGLNDV